MLYSHPEKYLKDHLTNVYNKAQKLFEEKNISYPDKIPLNHQKGHAILFFATLFHDFGKSTQYFQDYLFSQKKQEKNLQEHGKISALVGFDAYLKKYPEDKLGAVFVYLLILNHHLNLGNFKADLDKISYEEEIDLFLKQFKAIDSKKLSSIYAPYNIEINLNQWDKTYLQKTIKTINRAYRVLGQKNSLFYYFYFLVLFSILIFSDKEDAIFQSEEKKVKCSLLDLDFNCVKQEIDQFSTQTLLNQSRKTLFEIASSHIIKAEKEKIYSLNLPTGAGKTLNSFNLALKLLEKNPHKKIIYILPFTTIIDQNYLVFEKVLNYPKNDVLLKHHHAADFKYQTEMKWHNPNESSFLTESWHSKIIVSTFYQFFHTLFTSRNKNLKKNHQMVNSIVIIDEIQAIPVKYYSLLQDSFLLLNRYFNMDFIITTATKPLIFDPQHTQEIIKEDELAPFHSTFNRYQIHLHHHHALTIDEWIDEIQDKVYIEKHQKILVVANTIHSSKEIYTKLQGLEVFKDYEFLYLSSHTLPIHRKERIQKIKQSHKKLFIVSTQMIEAGVDIDVDLIFRDFAPLDSIVQTAGRLNRNLSKPIQTSILHLYRLKDEKREYNQYIYDFLLLNITKDLLKETQTLTEEQLQKTINKYYYEVRNKASQQEGREIKESLLNLNFENVQTEFNLIEDYLKVDFFVLLDNQAQEIKKKYDKICEKEEDKYEKRTKLLKLKNNMQDYIISVFLSKNLEDFDRDTINFVDASYYDAATGFNAKAPDPLIL